MKNSKNVFMLRLLALLLLLNTTNVVFAQVEETEETTPNTEETTPAPADDDDLADDSDFEDDDDDFEINIGNNNRNKSSHVRFSMIDIGISSFLYDGGFNTPEAYPDFDLLYGGSININWHIFRHRLPLQKRKLGLEYGLTLAWNDYKFSNDFIIDEDADDFITTPTEEDLKKNKLKTTFLEVPLMLTWTPGKRQSYFISAGAYAGVLIGSKQKIKTEGGSKSKFHDDFNLNKFRYGLEARLGLGAITFYAQYSLQELFESGQGPEIYPLNIGISLLGF